MTPPPVLDEPSPTGARRLRVFVAEPAPQADSKTTFLDTRAMLQSYARTLGLRPVGWEVSGARGGYWLAVYVEPERKGAP